MKKNHLAVIASGDSGLATYLTEVNKIPCLTEDEEFSYAKKYQNYADTHAAHMLVTSHLKLVPKIALTYKGYGLPIIELISEGNIGLMQAVKKFDCDKGFRLSTYATWWIRAAIQEYILRSWSLVKIGTTVAQKKLFFNLGKMKRKIQALTSREFNSQDFKTVAEELDVSENDVREMNIRMNSDFSLDETFGENQESTYLDFLADENSNQETILLEKQEKNQQALLLENAMNNLSDREKDIIQQRRLGEVPTTLDKLSELYGVSKERIRQIEEKAMEKIKNSILAN